MLNRNKSRKGFTLVEVIVVAVIVAILAAIGVPILSGFIADARQNSVNVLAETAAAAASSYYKKTGTDPNLGNLSLTYATKYEIEVPDPGKANAVKVTEKETSFTKSVDYK